MYTVYELEKNTDDVEGKGRQYVFMTTTTLDEAVEKAQGHGGMGTGAADIFEVEYASSPNEFVNNSPIRKRTKIYGWRSSINRPAGAMYAPSYGFLDYRDVEVDPEWAEYVRLRHKFKERKWA